MFTVTNISGVPQRSICRSYLHSVCVNIHANSIKCLLYDATMVPIITGLLYNLHVKPCTV